MQTDACVVPSSSFLWPWVDNCGQKDELYLDSWQPKLKLQQLQGVTTWPTFALNCNWECNQDRHYHCYQRLLLLDRDCCTSRDRLYADHNG